MSEVHLLGELRDVLQPKSTWGPGQCKKPPGGHIIVWEREHTLLYLRGGTYCFWMMTSASAITSECLSQAETGPTLRVPLFYVLFIYFWQASWDTWKFRHRECGVVFPLSLIQKDHCCLHTQEELKLRDRFDELEQYCREIAIYDEHVHSYT